MWRTGSRRRELATASRCSTRRWRSSVVRCEVAREAPSIAAAKSDRSWRWRGESCPREPREPPRLGDLERSIWRGASLVVPHIVHITRQMCVADFALTTLAREVRLARNAQSSTRVAQRPGSDGAARGCRVVVIAANASGAVTAVDAG